MPCFAKLRQDAAAPMIHKYTFPSDTFSLAERVAHFPENNFRMGSEVLAPQGDKKSLGGPFFGEFLITTGFSEAPKMHVSQYTARSWKIRRVFSLSRTAGTPLLAARYALAKARYALVG